MKAENAITTTCAWCAVGMSLKPQMVIPMPTIPDQSLYSRMVVGARMGRGRSGGEGEQPGMPDFAAAAAQLGITEEALMEALGDPSQGQPDFVAAAATLGVTEEALMEALGIAGQPGGRPGG